MKCYELRAKRKGRMLGERGKVAISVHVSCGDIGFNVEPSNKPKCTKNINLVQKHSNGRTSHGSSRRGSSRRASSSNEISISGAAAVGAANAGAAAMRAALMGAAAVGA
jgi:hypothetical protein